MEVTLKEQIFLHIKDKAIWVVLIALFIGFALGSERFIDSSNLITMLRQVSMYGIAAVGMTFVILTGGIDLSTGSIISLVGVVCATLMTALGFGMWPAILVSLVLATLVGVINGFMVSTIGIPALIATFATQVTAAGITLQISSVPVFGFTENFRFIGQGFLGNTSIPVPVIIMVICFALGSLVLNKVYYGRYFYAIGGNEEASRLSGIRVGRVKYLVYALSGFFAGLAGIVLLSRTNSAQPTAGIGWEFIVITCVVLGGVSIRGGFGKISNVVAGVLILGILNNGMVLMNISAFTQMVVQGIILAIAVGFDCWQKREKA